MPRTHFQLTHQLVAQHAGGGVFCLAEHGVGRTYRLHAERPGAHTNRTISARLFGRLDSKQQRAVLRAMVDASMGMRGSERVAAAVKNARGVAPIRSEVIEPGGHIIDVTPAGEPASPTVTVVTIHGPIEQRSSFYSECSGWGDGHDAIAERMIAALELGDVVMIIDSPGGAHAGLQEAIKRVQAEKAEHGRHVCVYADEMIGSAAYWWACSVGDEIFTPESGIIGSIGARGGHESIAGLLEQNGIAVTYFAWPGLGKVAFAPELPLSDIGKQRGERDVGVAGEAFAAAVSVARGLNRKAIVDLDADALPGAEAVRIGLADGVESLEAVMNFALARASGDEELTMLNGQEDPKTPDAEDSAAAARTEADETAAEDGAPPEPAPADKRACESCSSANEDDAKFCKSCGAAIPGMGADEDEDDEDDDDDDEPAPPSSKPGKDKPESSAHPPPPERADRADRLGGMSTAALLGLQESASPLAIKTAVMRQRRALDRMMSATETKTIDGLEGAVLAHVGDAKRLAQVEEKHANLTRAVNKRRRMDAAHRLADANVPGHERGKIFLRVDEKGEPLPKGHVRLAPFYRSMKLGVFESFVASETKNAPKKKASPFQADPAAARAGTDGARAQAAANNPVVKSIVAGARSTATPEELAAAFAAQFPTASLQFDTGV